MWGKLSLFLKLINYQHIWNHVLPFVSELPHVFKSNGICSAGIVCIVNCGESIVTVQIKI